MPRTWTEALEAYSYPADLQTYKNKQHYPGFFNLDIAGDRATTIEFENHYREKAPTNIGSYLEVVYWKLYSQPHRRNKLTDSVAAHFQDQQLSAEQLWKSITDFIHSPTIPHLRKIRLQLGFKTNVLAVPLTLVALANPETIPMIDNQVAKWVNKNLKGHNVKKKNKLIPFSLKYTSLRTNDFEAYLAWINWCREIAEILGRHTGFDWRARDVEMAVFTAQRNGLNLNPLKKKPKASDKELGKKTVEEEELFSFLEAYKHVVKEHLSYSFGRNERPDFICYRPDETPVGVELVRVMRDPREAQADLILDRIEFMDGEKALEMLYHKIEEKNEKRQQADWDLPDNTILVLQFVDCPISDLHFLDESLKKDFESYGFDEIWIADYTCEEAYGAIDLFCLFPPEWWGYYERQGHSWKPYG
ncbi:hypothetical protein D1BOALGB6SA_10310 [Olavius sp. associated proteobacterium Delta 1]|nr:hypothetical protein D1BOALGB6SA_10310 [Olavius sp. associated proteobacterium Delta 1]